jgi:hypothetical protein
MSFQKSKVTVAGMLVEFAAAVNLMDTDLCNAIHNSTAPCAKQQFVDAYCRMHKERFGEEFMVN